MSAGDAAVGDERPIFLVGFMGSGKSTVGRLLARHLGREFFDTDDLVVAREGRSIGRIFRESGESAFRRVEREALRSLDGRSGAVVATGGGLFQAAGARRWLRRHGVTVWLDAPFADCLRRVGTGTRRPLWAPGKDPGAFRASFEKRRAAYALADVRVAARGSTAEVARDVLSRLVSVSP